MKITKENLIFGSIIIIGIGLAFLSSTIINKIYPKQDLTDDKDAVVGVYSGFVDEEAYTQGVRFYNGAYYNNIKATSTLASNVTWYLPIADGSDGQVLKTNGQGSLSFVTSGTPSLASTKIFVGNSSNEATATSAISVLSSGYVGIGTSTPLYKFSVNGDSYIDGDITADNLNISNWDIAYGWGNHATAGYNLQSFASSTYSLKFSTIAGLSALTGETIASSTQAVGGEVSGTINNITLSNTALDDQYIRQDDYYATTTISSLVYSGAFTISTSSPYFVTASTTVPTIRMSKARTYTEIGCVCNAGTNLLEFNTNEYSCGTTRATTSVSIAVAKDGVQNWEVGFSSAAKYCVIDYLYNE